jgi:hypothetical protein
MADLDKDVFLTAAARYLEANPDVQSYSADGVSVSRHSLKEILDARERIRNENKAATRSNRTRFRRGPD